jgi:hypothetical protein
MLIGHDKAGLRIDFKALENNRSREVGTSRRETEVSTARSFILFHVVVGTGWLRALRISRNNFFEDSYWDHAVNATWI